MREGWEYKKLGEVATLINGFAFQSAMFQKAGLPIVRISNIQDDKITSDFVYFNRGDYNIDFEKYEVLYGDILIAMSGATTGKVGINYNDEVLYLNQRVGKIVPRENIIHRYLFYYLKTNAAKSLSIAQGVAQPNLSTQQINSFVLPVPPLSEQQRIVSELDLLSSIIEKKKAQLKEYDQLAQSIFYDMFGDPVANEKGWEVKKLGDCCNNCDSLRKPITAKDRIKGTIPYYGASGIVDYVKDYLFDGEYLLISEDGANLVFRSTPIAFRIKGKTWVNNHAHVLQFDTLFQQIFMEYSINLRDISSIVTGCAQPKLTQAAMNNINIPYPPLPLQQSFASKIEAIERQKALIQQSIAEVQMLFDSRMDDWFA